MTREQLSADVAMTGSTSAPAGDAPAYDFRQGRAGAGSDAWNAARLLFRVEDVPTDGDRPKYYVLEMFPYPSGKIHMGHVRNYTLGDVVARYKRARGFRGAAPDGVGRVRLAGGERGARAQAPIRRDMDLRSNIAAMRAELQRMGLSRSTGSARFATCDPEYYGQQQRLFLAFLKAGPRGAAGEPG